MPCSARHWLARAVHAHDHYVDLGPTVWPRLVAAMPNARLETIQNAGHSIWMDEAEAFTRSLRSALEATTFDR